jgi:hypothetical protein
METPKLFESSQVAIWDRTEEEMHGSADLPSEYHHKSVLKGNYYSYSAHS